MSFESFRNDLAASLAAVLPAGQLAEVLSVFDRTSSGYEISRKETALATTEGVPEAVRWYIAAKAISGRSAGTLRQYGYKLIHFFLAVRKPYTEITANDVRLYLYSFRPDRSDRYIENIRITLNGFFAWLHDNEYIPRNPCATVDPIRYSEKRREPLSAYDLELFRWSAVNIREKALIDFFFSTGVRVSECADVRLSDIDWSSRSVLIRHGKGDKARVVFFNAESELTLRRYLETRSDDTDALFVSSRAPHGPLKQKALENIITAVSKRCGIHVYPHRLRHTFATQGLRGGMPLETIQALMGHENPRTTMIYAKHDTGDLQRQHQRVYA